MNYINYYYHHNVGDIYVKEFNCKEIQFKKIHILKLNIENNIKCKNNNNNIKTTIKVRKQ